MGLKITIEKHGESVKQDMPDATMERCPECWSKDIVLSDHGTDYPHRWLANHTFGLITYSEDIKYYHCKECDCSFNATDRRHYLSKQFVKRLLILLEPIVALIIGIIVACCADNINNKHDPRVMIAALLTADGLVWGTINVLQYIWDDFTE